MRELLNPLLACGQKHITILLVRAGIHIIKSVMVLGAVSQVTIFIWGIPGTEILTGKYYNASS